MRACRTLWVLSALLPAISLADTSFSVADWSDQDQEFKLSLVQEWIKVAEMDGVRIRLPPEYYVDQVDSLVSDATANGDTGGLDTSLGLSLKTIAIMDCDWDDGAKHMDTARQFLGDDALSSMQRMYPDKYAALQGDCKATP